MHPPEKEFERACQISGSLLGVCMTSLIDMLLEGVGTGRLAARVLSRSAMRTKTWKIEYDADLNSLSIHE